MNYNSVCNISNMLGIRVYVYKYNSSLNNNIIEHYTIVSENDAVICVTLEELYKVAKERFYINDLKGYVKYINDNMKRKSMNKIFNLSYESKEDLNNIKKILEDNNIKYSTNDYSYKDNYILE